MTPDHLFTETATITDRTETVSRDTYGDVIVATATRTSPCYHEQTSRAETNQLAEQTWDLYLPAGTALTATAAVTIGSDQFEVIGPPWQTWNPIAAANGHVQATLRRTDG